LLCASVSVSSDAADWVTSTLRVVAPVAVTDIVPLREVVPVLAVAFILNVFVPVPVTFNHDAASLLTPHEDTFVGVTVTVV
jgi:hypothetical protein